MTKSLFCFITFVVVYGDVVNLQYEPKTQPVLEYSQFQYQTQPHEQRNYEYPQPQYQPQEQYQPMQQYQFLQQQYQRIQQHQPDSLETFYRFPLKVEEESGSGYHYNPPRLQAQLIECPDGQYSNCRIPGQEIIPSTPDAGGFAAFGKEVSEVDANVLKSLLG